MWSKSRGELILVGWVCINSRVTLVQWDVIMNGSQYLCCWLLQVKQLSTWLQTVEGFVFCMCCGRTPSSGRSSISKAVFLSLKSGFKKTWQWSRAYLLGLHCYRWGAVWTPCFILKYLSSCLTWQKKNVASLSDFWHLFSTESTERHWSRERELVGGNCSFSECSFHCFSQCGSSGLVKILYKHSRPPHDDFVITLLISFLSIAIRLEFFFLICLAERLVQTLLVSSRVTLPTLLIPTSVHVVHICGCGR